MERKQSIFEIKVKLKESMITPGRQYFDVVRTPKKEHFTELSSQLSQYSNVDGGLFSSIVVRKMKNLNIKSRIYTDELPECMTLGNNGYLTTVRINLGE